MKTTGLSENEKWQATQGVLQAAAPGLQEDLGELIKKAEFDPRPEYLAADIDARLLHLNTAALGGDAAAYRVIVRLACKQCAIVQMASPNNEDEQRKMARKMREWPMLFFQDRKNREKTMIELARLPLAADLVSPAEKTLNDGRRKKSFSSKTPGIWIIQSEFHRLKLDSPENTISKKPSALRRF